MEIDFQNKNEDYKAFIEYFIKETKQGKAYSMQFFRFRQIWIVVLTGLTGAICWGVTTQWQVGLRVFIIGLLLVEILILIEAKFKPIYREGIRAHEQQLKSWTTKDWQVFQLPKTIKIDDDWLEIRSLLVTHRWQWRIVHHVALAPNFIFIYNRSMIYAIIPKRSFSSEKSFIELGEKILKLIEKNKDQPIVENKSAGQ